MLALFFIRIFLHTISNGYFIGWVKLHDTTASSGVCLALMEEPNGADIIPLLFTSVPGQCKSTVYLKPEPLLFFLSLHELLLRSAAQEASKPINLLALGFFAQLKATLCKMACGLVLFH